MRAFIISICLFAATCSAIVINNIYIKNTADRIVDLVEGETFDSHPLDTARELEELWEKHHPIVGLSVGYKELDRMSDLIIDLKIQLQLGNQSEVIRLRAMIVECADEISRLEHFHLENLL